MIELDEWNRQIARQLRAKRYLRGESQQDVAEVLAVTYQQVQKYERGTNRISAAMLLYLCDQWEISPLEFSLSGRSGQRDDLQLTARETALLLALRGLEPKMASAIRRLTHLCAERAQLAA
ncbi:MAG: helix-turn-helix transcriptional regulator [Verrucomicrobiota bacterium JB022]|nr:helix-turn-helix transcriptional regulator [Verrucomicrobiota bacterium JB022]